MQFTVKRDQLLKPLLAVANVVEKRQTMPILSNVLLKVSNGRLEVTGTDLEVEVVVNAHIPVEQEGETTVSSRKLTDIVKSLPDGCDVSVAVSGNKMEVISGTGKYSLVTLPANDYPRISDFVGNSSLTVPGNVVKTILAKSSFAMAVQDVRYYLNGLLLELSPNVLRTVATDGHRLSMASQSIDSPETKPMQVILPRKAVMSLTRLLSDDETVCSLSLTDNHFRADFGDIQFTAKLIDGRFPDYRKVIPELSENLVVGDKKSLSEALSRASILANEKYRGVYLRFDENQVQIKAHNPEHEQAEETLPISYSGTGLEIGFNSLYLQDAVNAIDGEQYVMSVTSTDKSCVIKDSENDNNLYVVMPMRL